MTTVINHVREFRYDKGLTQLQLSRLADITPASVCNIELQDRPTPKIDTCLRLARALGTTVDELFELHK